MACASRALFGADATSSSSMRMTPSLRRSVWRCGVLPAAKRRCTAFVRPCPTPPRAQAPGSASVGLSSASGEKRPAAEAVRAFYERVNRGDAEGALALVSPDIVYEDMVYESPVVGAEALRKFLGKFNTAMSGGLAFVIDDISEEDTTAAGLIWHVEVRPEGIPFPFSRGCSFVRADDQGRICYVRDVVEPMMKPGEATTGLLGLLTPLVRKFPAASDPGVLLAPLPYWAVYAAYWWYVMLDPAAPGNPVYATTPETLASVLHQSANFGFVNVALNAAGLHAVPDIAENPVSEALFNFAAAWGLAFLPLMLTDRRCPRHVPTGPLWLGSWLLTNLFLTPWMARRVERGEPRGDDGREGGVARALSTPLAARGIGAVCAAMGLVAVAWLFVGRDGLGFADAGLPRVAELARLVTTSRVDYAFVADIVLYSAWQYVLMEEAPGPLRRLPFAGLCVWLVQGMPGRLSERS